MKNTLERGNEEQLIDYMLRLGKNKELYDLDWVEIADLLNKETDNEYTESKWRKEIQAYLRVYDHLVERNVGVEELEQKKIEILEERKKLQTVRVDYNKIAREKSRRELMFEHVREGFEKLPVPKFETILPSPTNDRVGVLSFGDIHFGKVFESLNNEYSEDIAKQRMEQLIAEVVDIIDKEGFTHIDIINGADSIEGMSLRVSQLQSLSTGFIDQTIKFSKFIAGWLNELSKFVTITYRHVPSSNHSEIRPFNSKRGEFPAEDLEKVIMHYVHDVLEDNERIEVPIHNRGIVDFKILDYDFVALHGHQIKGTKNIIKDLSMLNRKFYDYCFVFHYHHGNLLTVGQGSDNNIEVIQIPSIMGSDEYSDSLFTGAKPGANFSIFEKGKGRTISYNIILN